MKRNVYTDGNGSSLIQVEGMGVYVPASELEAAQAKIAQLQNDVLAKRIAELTGERDALAAQVEQLRNAAQAFSFSFVHDDEAKDIAESTLCRFADLQDCIAKTPAQCLAEVKAQAYEEGGSAQKAFWDGFERGALSGSANIRTHWNEYLQLRQQAKAADSE